jgi:hypothetical protein
MKLLCSTRLLVSSLFLLTPVLLLAQVLPTYNLANVPSVLSETSGLIVTGPNTLWSHNDSGDDPKLYAFDTTGTLQRTLVLRNAGNVDWEEITQDTQGRVYVGDFGNNSNNRTNLRIYRIPPPDQVSGDSVTAEIIDFDYPDQAAFPPPDSLKKFDMEAMVALGDSLYLFSKNRTSPFDGYTRCYRLPQAPGTYTAELVDSFYCGPGPETQYWVTAAALSPNGEHLVLLSSDRCWLFSCFDGSDFFSGSVVELSFPLSQKEAIAWRDDSTAFITDEVIASIFGGVLYRAEFAPWVLEPVVFLGNDTTVNGGSLLLDATFPYASSYSWSTGSNNPTITVTASGSYSVTVVAANGCIARDTIEVNLLTGLPGRGPGPSDIRLRVGPQPLPPTFGVSYELSGPGQIHFDVLDLRGREIMSSRPVLMAPGEHRETVFLPQRGQFLLRFFHDEKVYFQRLIRLD